MIYGCRVFNYHKNSNHKKTKKESTKIQNIFCEVSSQFCSKHYQYTAKNIMYSFYMFNSLSLVTAK